MVSRAHVATSTYEMLSIESEGNNYFYMLNEELEFFIV